MIGQLSTLMNGGFREIPPRIEHRVQFHYERNNFSNCVDIERINLIEQTKSPCVRVQKTSFQE